MTPNTRLYWKRVTIGLLAVILSPIWAPFTFLSLIGEYIQWEVLGER